eukprot:CAMPEP_0178421092 /NCGR_PEP_ID=MMETSP0689_2-20121128/26471_1 /TAXON_ID=160604 /ORGANISM="Amphidinium massartii, Strain CS-259" /LENGTH=953 /DNA_ID=CAMNT_0020042597 /DNA_START=133 /DNA_END=2994 /DNA_ORIENTATION=+
MSKKLVQNAGQAFWDKFELPLCSGKSRKRGQAPDEDEAQDDRPDSPQDKAKDRKAKREKEQKSRDGGLLKMSEELQGKDLYELLEVEAAASIEDIKKSYRKLVLVHHPDKLQDPTEEQRQHFLLVQEAFEILCDTQKRRRYESTLEFDDSVPTDFRKGEQDFFEVFRPVFKRNARWSTQTGVPDLGDAATPIEEVKKFYDFWFEFDSWRDPLAMVDQEELHNLEEAECREERRWMERENAKLGKKIKQEEKDRISAFVKLADKHDPRLVAYRESQRQAKEEERAKKAAEKEAEKKRIEAEVRAKEEALEAKRQAEEAKKQAERKAKEEQKQILKNARQRLRGLHKHSQASVRRAVHADQLQEVCLQLGVEELESLSGQLEAALEKEQTLAIELLHAAIKKYGGTPIEDLSVKIKADGDTASTGSPDSGNDDDSDDADETDATPQKSAKVKSPEELEAERLMAERRAEEQRKKKEQQKKQDEARMAALRKEEAKEKKAQEREKEKAAKKIEDEKRKREEEKQRKLKQAEDQRLASIAQDEEKKRLQQEAARADAFAADRAERLDMLESEDSMLANGGDLAGVIQKVLLEPSDKPSSALKAMQVIAKQLPSAEQIRPPKAPDASLQGKKKAAAEKAYLEEKATAEASEQARRETEEFCVDLATACMIHEGHESEQSEVAAKLCRVLPVALRPPGSTPEVSKDMKNRIKKQRLRLRTTVLRLLRQVESSSDGPAEAPAASGDAGVIKEGTQLVVLEEGPIFESPSSYETIGEATVGKTLVAAGPPVDVEGYSMVPLRPSGTIERRIVKVSAPAATEKPSKKGKGSQGEPAKKQPPQESPPEAQLPEKFRTLANLAADSADIAESELEVAFYLGFDPTAGPIPASVAEVAPIAPEEPEAAPAVTEAVPDKTPSKKNKKAGKDQSKGGQEEDLDALLSEFGLQANGSEASKKKKKGKS